MTAWLLALSIALGVLAAVARARRWFRGRPAAIAFWRGLVRFPRSYFVDLHHIVARDSYAARMHILVAGGFTASILLVILIHLFGVVWMPLAWLALVMLAVMAAGAALVALRRISRASRLSAGSFNRLPWSLFAFALFFAIATLPIAGLAPPIDWTGTGGLLLLAAGAWGCLEMIAGLPVGPMKHAYAGALHLICHPRPARLGASRPDSALRPLDLNAAKLGAETARDFAWNRLLGFDACVQCGRCEAVCPAFAAELPLNPKKLIQDLVASLDADGTDQRYAGSPHPGRAVGQARGAPERPIVGPDSMVHPDTLWACTTCRACVYECPMMIEHVDAIVDLRRFQALELGAVPGKGPGVIAELRAADNPGGHALASRLDWAADLALPIIAQRGSCDVLLWLGDGAFDLRNQRTLRAVVRLLRHVKVDFAVLGEEELDTGDIARRLGDEATFQDLARRNVATLAKYQFKRILTCDPHVLHSLRNEYLDLGARYDVVHHSTFMAELVRSGVLTVAAPRQGAVTYHDPCYLGRYNGETQSPRAILDALGIERVEMERSGMRSMCCGGGGGAPITDIAGKRRIPDMRMDQARATGASVVAVACPNCAIMLEGVVGSRPDVADIAELLLQGVEGSA
jgi:Fe-S oxidoreductase